MSVVDWLPALMFVLLLVLVFSSYPIAFVLGGLSVLFGLIGWLFGVFSPVEFYNFTARIWFIAENLQIISVPCFVFMGVMLERAEIAQDLLRACQRLLRGVPGGMAMGVTVMGTIMAAITGIIGASVVVMTLIALPTMLAAGYRAPLALGTIAAASTLGVLIPPSILLVFIGEMLAISPGILFAAALLPGLLLAALYLVWIFGYSVAVPAAAPPRSGARLTREETTTLLLRGVLPPLVLIVLVLGSVMGGLTTVTESAAVGAAGALLLAAARGRLSRTTLAQTLHRSTLMIGMIFCLFAGATCFTYVFRVLGGEELILGLLDYSALDSWGVLLLIIAFVFVMGFFFDVLEILLVVIPLFAPLVGTLEFAGHVAAVDVPYWFGILLAVTLQTSFLTPPMGLALFYVRGAAPPSVSMRQIYAGVVPFVALQLACVALVMRFPAIALWLPHRLEQ